ncbi:hypothetical protein ACIQSP_16370 [Streptomyces nigra]|uniref:hypothetical protein n=1 Tax=Streptomyces nigra TaxID=1827580 RepID=UPI00380D37E8
MAFPEDSLGVKTELAIGGVMTDVTEHAMTRDIITHTRGQTAEGQAADPASCSLTLKSPNGLYSPRNPRSPYFRKIGRNTPMQVAVHTGLPGLDMRGLVGDHANTPDTAALDITGDIDLRLDATFQNWVAADTVEMLGKLAGAGGTKSWLLATRARKAYFEWSADGTAALSASSTVDVPLTSSGRQALRVTLDVDNGAGGRTITFYTAPTMAGPWVQLGAQVVQAGTTSIFNSATEVRVGDATTVAFSRPIGRVHKVEIRNGINGTAVANPDFTAQAIGSTSFTDGAGRTWTLNGSTAISNKQIRFVGEFSDWPAEWSQRGDLITVEGAGVGLLERMNQGTKVLASTLRRRIPSFSPVAYWPMEEGSDATTVYSPLAGVNPFMPTALDFASDDTLPGSSPLPVVQPGASFVARAPVAAAGTWQVELVYNLDAMPSAETTLFEVRTTGTARRVRVRVATNLVRIDGLDAEDTQVFMGFTTAPQFTGAWNRLQIKAIQSGGNVQYVARWIIIGGTGFSVSQTIAATPGYVVDVRSSFGTGLDGMRFGHITVFNEESDAPFNSADRGFNGETAAARMVRLCAEEGVPFRATGVVSETMSMGPQRPGTLLGLLQECADADGGIFGEERDWLGLRYRARTSLYNQAPALTLQYGMRGLAQTLRPVDDTSTVRNDITVNRVAGGSGRAVLEEGRLSVQDPPNGVGVYDEGIDLNLFSDDLTEPAAHWRLHLGTWDEARYPTVTVRLHRAPQLIETVLGITEGDVIRITDLPDWVPPGPIDLLVQGYTERIGTRTWEIDFVCVPAGPYRVGVVGSSTAGRVDANPGGSFLQDAVSESATALTVHTPARGAMGPAPWITSSGPAPTYPAEFPISVLAAGEEMSVTAIRPWVHDAFGRSVAAGGWGTATDGQAWTLVAGAASERSVNGSRGVVSLPSSPSTIRYQLTPGSVGDCEVRCRMSVSAVATGAPFIPAVLLRYAGAGDYYRARVHFGLSGAMQVSIARDTTQIGSAVTLPYTYAAADEFEVRVRLTGHLVQIRVWPVGQLEPSVWHTAETVVTTPVAAGQVGLAASSFAGNTNVSPSLLFDDFVVVTPQAWTVTRSVNGVSKAQVAGEEVRVARPAVVAL